MNRILKVGNQYIIHFKGLRDGKHDFDFQITNEFFEENSTLDIKSGDLSIKVLLAKHASFLDLHVDMEGEVNIQCDRCLENFDYPIHYQSQLFVKFKDEPDEPDENVIFLHPNDDKLDLNQYFFDCIGLSIPIQKFHPEDEHGNYTCNDEMLAILDEHESKSGTEDAGVDPRWSKLQNLLNDNKTNN